MGYRDWYVFLHGKPILTHSLSSSGQCLKAFSNGKIPYVIRFHPDEDKQHIFLAGMSDKKIVQVNPVSSAIEEVLC